MARLFLCLFCLLGWFSAAAQESAQQPEKCVVEGVVVRADTSEPLKKARILLRRAEGRRAPSVAVTGADGRFTLREIEPGRYRLSVERNGFVRQEYGQRTPYRQGSILSLETGQAIRDLIFRLLPAATITGRVFDEDGEPLARVSLQAYRYSYWQGRRQLVPAGGDGTNDLGEYRLWGLAPGRYFLSATYSADLALGGSGAPTTPSDSGQQEEAYASTYYPGTNDASRATAIELRPGEQARAIDFTLVPTPAVRVRGRVFNSVTGRPGQGAQVMLLPREVGARGFFMRNQAHVDDAEGKFELRGITPGRYLLVANWFEDNRHYSARLPLDVGATHIEGVQLVIGPGVELPGRLQVEGSAQNAPSDLRVSLAPRDEMSMFGSGSATLKADGTFVLQNIPEGNYRVSVFPLPEGFYLKAARAGTEDVLASGLMVARGKTPALLDVVISPNGGQVEGQVLNEEKLPVAGAAVGLVPHPDRRAEMHLYKSTTTDQFGRFTLRGVAPGEYKLFAWEEVEPGAYQDAEFLRPVESRGVTVQVQEGGRQAVELKAIPAHLAAN